MKIKIYRLRRWAQRHPFVTIFLVCPAAWLTVQLIWPALDFTALGNTLGIGYVALDLIFLAMWLLPAIVLTWWLKNVELDESISDTNDDA